MAELLDQQILKEIRGRYCLSDLPALLAHIDAQAEIIDGAMNDLRSCGEISCEECDLRTQSLRAQLKAVDERVKQAKREVWNKAIGLCRVDEGMWEDAAKYSVKQEYQTFHRALRDAVRSVITALEAARKQDLAVLESLQKEQEKK